MTSTPDRMQENGTSAQENPSNGRLPWRLVGGVVSGTLLNPLNSSMIAVALLSLSVVFHVSIPTATWLISGFYLGGAIGMPLMGRLADSFGPRRIFSAGLLLVGLTSTLAPLAPAFGWLLVIRILQAFGTATAYPAGLAIMRAQDRRGRAPAAALGAVSIASSVSAALGPVLGGGLVAVGGWPAIFLVNIPVIMVGLFLAWRWLPPDPPHGLSRAAYGMVGEPGPPSQVTRLAAVRSVDLPGVVLFSGLLVGALGFLLSLPAGPMWLLLLVAVLAAIAFVLREYRASSPFLDLRLLVANRALAGVYAQFAAVNIVFYTVFFGLPLWLEEARGYTPGMTGVLLLPVAGIGVLSTPVSARLIARSGPRLSLIVGSFLLLLGCFLLLALNVTTPVPVLLVIGAVLGVPNGFNNLGLQAALYEAAPASQIGAAGGLLQTCRYIGAIFSTALIALILGTSATSEQLHTLALIIAVISALLVVASMLTRGMSDTPDAKA